jgi:hypothetical protein
MKHFIFILSLIYSSIAVGQTDSLKASKPRHNSKEMQPFDFYLGIFSFIHKKILAFLVELVMPLPVWVLMVD